MFGFPWVFSSRWTCAVESQKGRQCTSLSHRSRGERRASVGRREPRLTDDVSGTRLAARLQALNCVTSPAGAGGGGPRNRLAAVHKARAMVWPLLSALASCLGARLLSRPFSFPGSLLPRAPYCSFGPAEHAPAFAANLPSGVHSSVTPLEKSSLTARSKIAAPFLPNSSSRFVHHT